MARNHRSRRRFSVRGVRILSAGRRIAIGGGTLAYAVSAASGGCPAPAKLANPITLCLVKTVAFCNCFFSICSKFLAVNLCRYANRWFRMGPWSWLVRVSTFS